MGYHPRIESKTLASFQTSRSRNSELWFINNHRLEQAILGFTAKYAARYKVKLYALSIEGNHKQLPALFPGGNRSMFMRDLNSSVARAIPRYVAEYPGGRFFGRRYSSEFLPGNDDIEEYFFYTVLQAVHDGLVEKISEYPGYNCFADAVWGRARKFKVVRWGEYNAARRHNPSAAIKDFTEVVELKFERLPGYEGLSQREYAHLMMGKLEEHRQRAVQERLSKGLGFLGRDRLLKMRPGALPKHTKTSTINDHRPRVLSICPKRRAECLAWYFSVYDEYLEASRRYRQGELDVIFPEGTYKPHSWCPPPSTAGPW